MGSFDSDNLTDTDLTKNVKEFDEQFSLFEIKYVEPEDKALRTTLPLCINRFGGDE